MEGDLESFHCGDQHIPECGTLVSQSLSLIYSRRLIFFVLFCEIGDVPGIVTLAWMSNSDPCMLL